MPSTPATGILPGILFCGAAIQPGRNIVIASIIRPVRKGLPLRVLVHSRVVRIPPNRTTDPARAYFTNRIVQRPINRLHLTGNSVFYQPNRERLTFLTETVGLTDNPGPDR